MVCILERYGKKTKGIKLNYFLVFCYGFSYSCSYRCISRKQIMKMDQIKLLEEAEAYKKHAADMNDMGCIIQSKSNFHIIFFFSVFSICEV